MQAEAYGELLACQKNILLDKLAQCRSRLEFALALDAQLCGSQYATDHIHEEIFPAIVRCAEFLKKDQFSDCAVLLRELTFGQLRKKKSVELTAAEQALIKGPVDKVKGELKTLIDFALLNADYEQFVGTQVGLQTTVLMDLLGRFDANYRLAKQSRNVLDFADLEHGMLKLLDAYPAVAQKLKERFDYLFVDEYQDINAVQQRIIESLSRDDNVFVVGDIKQSIYGFRQSKPDIFLRRLQTAESLEFTPSIIEGGTASGAAEAVGNRPKPCLSPSARRHATQKDKQKRCLTPLIPALIPAGRVDLQENFRCRGEIVDFVNALFATVMTTAVADMDYDEKAKLKSRFDYPPFAADGGPDCPVELTLLDEDSTADDTQDDEKESGITESISAVQRQAAFIAQRIRQIVGDETGKPEFQIYDKKTNAFRDVQYRDIVILMRSLSHKAQDYVEMLRLAGVPVSSQSACGYFEATEISDCLCLLKVLDNADRDIELAALLRGPIFGVTDSQLATIRLYAEENSKSEILNPKQIQNSNTTCSKQNMPAGSRRYVVSFYQAMLAYADSGKNKQLRQTLNDILFQLNQWRRQVHQDSLANMLDGVYRQKRLLSFYSALPNGAQRRANLLKLHDHAIQFEHFRTTEPGAALTRFVEFLEKLAAAEQDWAPAEPDSSGENAVRIMSVHKSKGLEFPVVFVAELNTSFNMRAAAGQCLINEDTVGLQIIDRAARGWFPTLAHQVIAERQKKADLAEEMRILYVALTRAREKLILTASKKEDACVKVLTESAAFADRIADWRLNEVRCHLDWVLMGMSRNNELCRMFDLDGVDGQRLFCAGRIGRDELDGMTRRILDAKRSLKSYTNPPKAGSKADGKAKAAFEMIGQNLLWQYPFEEMTRQAAKLSVSEFTHRDDEFSGIDLTRAFAKKPAGLCDSGEKSSGADALSLGSAVHLILEHMDLSKPVDAGAVEKTITQLANDERLSPAIIKQIDPAAILAFFNSELGQMAQAAGKTVLREWPFTYALAAGDIGEETKDEIVVLQGIVDMIIPTEKGLVIVDFKTDRVTEETVNQRAEQYTEQLGAYARAAGDILKQPVRSAWLYFLTPQKAIQIT